MRMTESAANQMCISTRCRSVEQFISMFQRYVQDDSIFMSTLASRPHGLETAFVIVLADGTPVLRGTAFVRETWKTAENPFHLPGILLGIKKLSPRSMEVFQRMRLARGTNTLPSLAPPPTPTSPWDEESFIGPLRPVVRASSTKQYFSPAQRLRSHSGLELVTRQRPAVPVPDVGESFSAPTRLETSTEQSAVPAAAGESFSAPTRLDTPVRCGQLPQSELHTPAADCIMPANPLAKLTDEALAGYIDCTLYESTHSQPLVVMAAIKRRVVWWCAAVTAAAVTIGVAIESPLASENISAPAMAVDPEPLAPDVREVRNEQAPVCDGPCRLSVFAAPAGSTVTIDGELQGHAPITLATECGQHRIDIAHPTHRTLTTWATLAPGETESIDVTLPRPIHAVAVTSRPAGATIYVDGAFAGQTPKVLNVLGHVPVTVELKKPGYRPVTQRVANTTARGRVAVRMLPVKRPPRAQARAQTDMSRFFDDDPYARR